MKERPIIFSTEMVRAILNDRKTQTRRVIKPQPLSLNPYLRGNASIEIDIGQKHKPQWIKCPYGQPGDRLWVRESWHIDEDDPQNPYYKAEEKHPEIFPKWNSPIHMPRWASRITLEITKVRVERLQEISEYNALKEGCQSELMFSARTNFIGLWNSLHKKEYRWEDNPWVWVVSFKRVKEGK